MSFFIRATGGMLGSIFAVIRNDDRVQQANYSGRWQMFGQDMLWPRSTFVGYSSSLGVSNFDLSNALDLWEMDALVASDAMAGQRRDSISGVTRDSTGAALGGVSVRAFDLARDLLVDSVVSDATTGAFTVTTPYVGQTMYCVAYKAGTPVYGASSQLTPS
jgi:hypothetical protein